MGWYKAKCCRTTFPSASFTFPGRIHVFMSHFLFHRYLSALHFTFGGLATAELGGGREYSCAEGLGTRIVDALPDYLPSVRALRLPAVQVTLCLSALVYVWCMRMPLCIFVFVQICVCWVSANMCVCVCAV
jgi:hypothetical protein